MDKVVFRDFEPGDRDWLVSAHAEIYADEEGFDASFGPMVGGVIDAYFQGRDCERERGWVAVRGNVPVGTIVCSRQDDNTAKLRLFLVLPSARGLGLGKDLVDRCLKFARQKGYSRMTLWTFKGLETACALYARAGFEVVSESRVRSFGVDMIEQIWAIDL